MFDILNKNEPIALLTLNDDRCDQYLLERCGPPDMPSAMFSRADTVPGRRRGADEIAAGIMADSPTHKRELSDDDVLNVLNAWKFKKNVDRKNVMPDDREHALSDSVGLAISRIGVVSVLKPHTSTSTSPSC